MSMLSFSFSELYELSPAHLHSTIPPNFFKHHLLLMEIVQNKFIQIQKNIYFGIIPFQLVGNFGEELTAPKLFVLYLQWGLVRMLNSQYHIWMHVKLNFKVGLFSSTFCFERISISISKNDGFHLEIKVLSVLSGSWEDIHSLLFWANLQKLLLISREESIEDWGHYPLR